MSPEWENVYSSLLFLLTLIYILLIRGKVLDFKFLTVHQHTPSNISLPFPATNFRIPCFHFVCFNEATRSGISYGIN